MIFGFWLIKRDEDASGSMVFLLDEARTLRIRSGLSFVHGSND
jgi:hypothetical protein